MQHLYKITAALVEDLSEHTQAIAKGLGAVGRSAPAIGNSVEAVQLVADGASKFLNGDKRGAAKQLVKGALTLSGLDAQMLTDNVKQVKEAMKNGGVMLGAAAAVLGVTELVATAALGSQYLGGIVRGELQSRMAISDSLFLESSTISRTNTEIGQAKDSVNAIMQRKTGAKAAAAFSPA